MDRYFITMIAGPKGSSYTIRDKQFIKGKEMPVSKDIYDYLVKRTEKFSGRIEIGPEFHLPVTSKNRFKLPERKDDGAMNVAIVCSPDWAHAAAIEVFALFKNNPPPVRVYILSDDMGYIDLDPICKLFGKGYSYEYINMESEFKRLIPSKINVDGRFTKYALYRLLIPSLIPEDRVLYIDADAIVNGDISEFYNMDLGENIVAGVQDTGIVPFLKSIDFDPDALYINAGVTLIDLKRVRELNLEETWLEMVNSKFYHCHDQDIINITCKDRIALVDDKFNTSISTGLTTDEEEVKIMHYAGSKPWLTDNVPYYGIWEHWYSEYVKAKLPLIPKKVHYCWFGGGEKPDKIKACLESWQEHLPGYEIIEWNESNFDFDLSKYAQTAYDLKKYAFVTDYIRMWALYNYGGIYMDADVEVLKPLDRFLVHRAFTGHETPELMITATMGAEPKHPWIELLLNYYTKRKFVEIPNTQTITAMSTPLVKKRLSGFTHLKDDVVIYPVEVFCPYDHQNLKPTPTKNSYAIHHFAGTWLGRTKV